MRTARSSSRRGGGSPCRGLPPSWGVSLRGVGVPPSQRGVSVPGGVPPSGGVLPAGGGCLLPRGSPCQGGFLDGRSPPVNRMTNRCKNITLPQTSFAGGKNTRSSQKINSNIYGKQCISLPRLDSSKTF